MAREEFKGAAVETSLVGAINATATSFVLNSVTGWPDGTVGDFVVTLDGGSASLEKVLCASRTGITVVVATSGRGYDDTVATTHTAGAKVQHTISAAKMDELDDHVHDTTNDQHTQYLNVARHDVTARHPTAVIADGAITNVKLATDAVTADKIAADAVGASEIAANAVTALELAADAVTTAKILDANVTTAKLADASVTEAKLGTDIAADVIVLVPRSFAATLGSPVLSESIIDFDAWLFDPDAVERISTQVVFPGWWTTFDVTLYWANDGAGTGDVRWNLFGGGFAASDTLVSGTLLGGVTSTAGVQNVLVAATVASGVATNTLVNLVIQRNATVGSDTLTSDAALYCVKLTRAS